MVIKINILRNLIVILALLPLSTFSLLGQEIKVVAPIEVVTGEVFQVQYDILTEIPVRTMPKIKNTKHFDIIGKPVFNRSEPPIFWDRSNYVVLRMLCNVRVRKAGEHKVPNIELVYDGKIFSSERIPISVIKPPKPKKITYFTTVDATRKSMNVGDTLLLTYKLYTTEKISNVLSLNVTRFKNFQYQDITPNSIVPTTEKIKGVEYNVYTLRKFILKASSLGVHEWAGGRLEIEYNYLTGRKRTDNWGQVYDEEFHETKACNINPITLRVHNMINI